MRKLLILLSLILSFSICSGKDVTPPSTPLPIPITPKGNDRDNNRPHDEAAAITAYYQNGAVYISMDSYERMAEINVTNTTSGHEFHTRSSTAYQPMVIEINPEHGHYIVTLSTEIGNTYFGEFSL